MDREIFNEMVLSATRNVEYLSDVPIFTALTSKFNAELYTMMCKAYTLGEVGRQRAEINSQTAAIQLQDAKTHMANTIDNIMDYEVQEAVEALCIDYGYCTKCSSCECECDE